MLPKSNMYRWVCVCRGFGPGSFLPSPLRIGKIGVQKFLGKAKVVCSLGGCNLEL